MTIKNYGLIGVGANVEYGLRGGTLGYDSASEFTFRNFQSNLSNVTVNILNAQEVLTPLVTANLVNATGFTTPLSGNVVIDAFDDDGTLAANSASRLVTQRAILEYLTGFRTDANVVIQPDFGNTVVIDTGTDILELTGGTSLRTTGFENIVTLDLAPDIAVDSIDAGVVRFALGISDPGNLLITQFDDDGTFAADSATRLATQRATKEYVDNTIDQNIANIELNYSVDGGNVQTILTEQQLVRFNSDENIDITGNGNVITFSLGATLTLDNVAVDNFTVNNDLFVGGNLFIQGNTATIEQFVIGDTLIQLGNNNVTDIFDIGFVGQYTQAGNTFVTGLARDATDGNYKLFTGLAYANGDLATNQVNFANASTATLFADVTGNLVAFDFFADNLQFGNLISGNTSISSFVDSTQGLDANVDNTSIPTSRAVLEYVNVRGDGFILRTAFAADGNSNVINLGSLTDIDTRTYYVGKVTIDVSTAFAGGTVDYVEVLQGNTVLVQSDDADILNPGTYFVDVGGVPNVLSNSNISAVFYDAAGNVATPTTGNLVTTVYYNWTGV
jgi:hypothetical protein